MKKALITGISGFVGPYLKTELEEEYDIYGLERNVTPTNKIFKCDLLDKKSVSQIIKNLQPDMIFHLAGFSSVKASWEQPELCRDINVNGTKNLLDAIQENCSQIKILVVSSAEIYGNPVELPLKETSPISPKNPYAQSRMEQEQLLQNYKNIPWVIARSFNHTGPGQLPIFVIPEFAKQLAEIKKQIRKPVIQVGNLESKRDFSDVRDVVHAYKSLLERGKEFEIYNVCSGNSYKISYLLDSMISMIGSRVEIVQDKNKFRPVDIQELRGDNNKIKALGYINKYSILDTLQDSLNWWLKKI